MEYRNQTNLALKGMIGIGAMAVISNLTGNTQEAQNYTSIANKYISQWLTLGIASNDTPPHATLAYGQNNTHGMSSGVAFILDFPWRHKLIMSIQVYYTISLLTLNWV
jgi:glutaminase A-like protein